MERHGKYLPADNRSKDASSSSSSFFGAMNIELDFELRGKYCPIHARDSLEIKREERRGNLRDEKFLRKKPSRIFRRISPALAGV